jgi:anti-anti-sigma regulatory factor
MTKEARPIVLCGVAGVPANTVAVAALARLALLVRRAGCQLHLCGASEELCALVKLMGLDEVLSSD